MTRIAGAGNPTPVTQTISESESDSESPTELQHEVTVGEYSWEDYKQEYYYDDDGSEPEEPFDANDHLHLDVETIGDVVEECAGAAKLLTENRNENTVFIDENLDEDAFFSDEQGNATIVNRYDLEKSVPEANKSPFHEVDRYWVNKPYAFVIIFHSEKENEKKYYLIEPYLTSIERDLREFLSGKLKTAIKYSSDEVVVQGNDEIRADVINRETRNLLDRYNLYDTSFSSGGGGFVDRIKRIVGRGDDDDNVPRTLTGLSARPEPVLLDEDSQTLSEYQVQKLLYLLKRDFIGFERIDGIKHDINVEDISCDGYNSPVFVYHSDFEQIISNVYHGEERLDDFVVKLAQRSGKGISKRQPQVDATLPDGSRAQLTLGPEVSDHGTNYTIRQFKDVPFTPLTSSTGTPSRSRRWCSSGSVLRTISRSSLPAGRRLERRHR